METRQESLEDIPDQSAPVKHWQKAALNRLRSSMTAETVSPSNSLDSSMEDGSYDSEDYSGSETGSDEEETDHFEPDDTKFQVSAASMPLPVAMQQMEAMLQQHEQGLISDDSMESDDSSALLSGSDDGDEEDESISDSDYGSEYSGSDVMSSSALTDTEGDWSSEDEDEYDDLMADLPIALGRTGGPRARPIQLPPRKSLPAPTEGLPMAPLNMNNGVVPEMDPMNPMEGLAMLQNIRSELEQVGRMIVAKKDGEKFLQRAHILASINWLSTNIPACVLDHLGKEIRASINKKKKEEEDVLKSVPMIDTDEEGSIGSELSDLNADDIGDFDDSDDFMDLKHELTGPRRVTQEARTADPKGQAITKAAAMMADPEEDEHRLPSVSYFQCALVFVDISGFTKLATLLDPENLSKVINSYFQVIVDKVSEFRGDIQKFAGDALFAEWRVSPSQSLTQCVQAAAACATALVRECADFPVMAFGGAVSTGSPVTHLNVHCGLGVGEMAGIHIGDSRHRREYVYVGNPVEQATQSCDKASLGQVVASKKAYNVLTWSGTMKHEAHLPKKDQDFFVVSDRSETRLNLSNCNVAHVRNARSRGVTEHVDGLQVDALIEYRRLMSLYVHPVVVSNDVAAGDGFRSSRVNTQTHERHREEAELRSVFVVFINPQVPVDLSGNDYKESARRLNAIMLLTTRELERYNGHLRQFIMDDKGLVLIATFGLRGSTFPNMVAERALPATVVLHNALQMELGIDSKIGASFGDVYCGPVGGIKRNEYAVMGPSVNLAARLMASPENPGILVDNAVRQLASRSYCFNALEPVIAKGYKEPVPIFEPLAALERSWGEILPTFVGRQDEMRKILRLAKEMTADVTSSPRLVLISSPSGMGKTTMLAQSIEQVRKMLGPVSRKLLIAKHVGKENDAPVPFKTIRPVLFKALEVFRNGLDARDGRSIFSGGASHTHISFDLTVADTMTVVSNASSQMMSVAQAADCLSLLGAMMNVPDGLVDLVKRVVFDGPGTSATPQRLDAITTEQIVRFVAQIFRRCTQELKLTIIALDDVHHADAASWLVLREIFESADNVLIIGTSFNAESYTFRIEEEFWNDLNDSYLKNGRFLKMELGRLGNFDLELLTMKTLGVRRDEVSSEILNEVVVQSGGMPHFASKILQGIKERNESHGAKCSADKDDSIAEIILHRVDSFDLTMRNTLNVGAVLGESFSFADVLAVMKESSDAKEDDLRRQTTDSLKESVTEGILFVGEREGPKTFEIARGDEGRTVFTFYHKVWRSTLLGLMLDSRKRDVHRKIALSMEKKMEAEEVDIEHKAKLFSHWRSAGDTTKATKLAMQTGQEIENDYTKLVLSIALYRETLSMWGWDRTAAGNVAGFSSHVLDNIGADDLSNILRLMVAFGRALYRNEHHKESVAAFQDALRVLQVAKAGTRLRDRSVIFPAFVGLSEAIADGHIHQDVQCRYEQTMLRRFLTDTRIHGRLIHHIYALYLQMLFYARQDELKKAIAAHSIIKKLYKPEKHSKLMRNVYGVDSGAVSFAFAAYFEMIDGDNRQALKSCRRIFKELVPKVQTDFDQSFSMAYPLVLILKEAGYAREGRGFFEKMVVQPYGDRKSTKDSFSMLTIYEPLQMLLSLAGKEELSQDKLSEYTAWATKKENVVFADSVNVKLGRLGRDANSISAEICLLLAAYSEEGEMKQHLVDIGKQLASSSAIFLRRHGLTVARKQSQAIVAKLRMINCENSLVEW